MGGLPCQYFQSEDKINRMTTGLAITVDRTNKLFILFQISAGPARPRSQVSDDQIVDYNYSKVSKQIFRITAGSVYLILWSKEALVTIKI